MKYREYVVGLVIAILGIIFFAPQEKDWVDTLGSLGPVIVAGMVGYVAWKQYEIESYKKQTMFYNEKMQALEDLYVLLCDALSITEKELSESVNHLKDSKRGMLLQKFYVLNIRFKTLFQINDVWKIRELFEEKNMARLRMIEYRKIEGYHKERVEDLNISNSKDKEIEDLHKKIQNEVLKIVSL